MRLVIVFMLMMLTTASCSSGITGFLMGGGPKIAANVQAGKTNSQTIGTTNNVEQKVEAPVISRDLVQSNDKTGVKAETVGNVKVSNTEPWVILLLVVGWLLPSPNEIGRWVLSLFKRKTK